MKKIYLSIIGIVGILAVGAAFLTSSVSANPTSFPYTDCGNHNQVAATTTNALASGLWIPGTASSTGAVYMTTGASTSTCVYDSYQSDGHATQSGSLLVVLNSTTSLPTLYINEEFSQDGLTWYQGSQTVVANNATTTITENLALVPQYQWKLATSSVAGLFGVPTVGTATTTYDTRIIAFTTPVRFERFIFTLPSGSAAAGVWAQIIPLKQNP